MAFMNFSGSAVAAVCAVVSVMAAGLASGGDGAFANASVALRFDDAGRIASLRETTSGRELVAEAVPMVSVRRRDGQEWMPTSFCAKGDRLSYGFPEGFVDLTVAPFDGGWTFTVSTFTVPDATALQFARVMPTCTKWNGVFVNGMSDERSAVVLRAYDLETEMYSNGSMGLKTYASRSGIVARPDALGLRLVGEMPERGFVGLRGGLAAGPRSEILCMLRGMTRAAGVPQTDFGGAWSLGSAGVRRSYLFADLAAGAIDDWIDLARRSGFGTIHFHAWWEWLGHYYPRKEFFPGGLSEMKSVVGKVHAAGLTAGIHTLTGSIDPEHDPWVRPEASSNLLAVATYTLARPLAPDSTELCVNERPIDRHEFVHTYFSSGHTLRLGTELVNYEGLSRERPYRFTGLKRGVFGTRAQDHAAGSRCDYLRQRYLAFYPDPDTPLVRDLASCISNVYATCGFDQVYFDGSEGSGTRYATDKTRRTLFASIDQHRGPVLMESSCQGPHNWWFHCRFGARDIPYLGAKRFHDAHIRDVREQGELANFLAPQLGWWQPRLPTEGLRGHFPDEMEYFAGKNAGWDAASAVLGADVTKGPLPLGVLRQMTILGWYERPRVAGAFRREVLEGLRRERAEFRLRQDDDGVWRIRPVDVLVHRVADATSRRWQFSRTAASPAGVRVEALYTPDDSEWETGETLVRGSDIGVFAATATTNRSVSFPGPRYRDLKGKTGFGLKVRGDGSGALLNIQFRGAPQYGQSLSEHYVKLDFTGWRYFSFLDRERDSASAADHVWPYDTSDRVCGTLLDSAHLAGVDFWLNDIPAGGKATVEVSDVRLLSERKIPLGRGCLTLNGKSMPLPFPLEAGEYAELEEGAWVRYSAEGVPLERKVSDGAALATGLNELVFAGGRAEVTVFALGPKRAAFVDLADEMRRGLAYEACEPARYAPKRGLDAIPVLAIRPGERASLRLSSRGTLADPRGILYNGAGETIPVTLPCKTRSLVGTWRLKLADPAADVELDLVKDYQKED